MNFRSPQAAVAALWGLVAVFAVVQAVAWTLAGGVPRRPIVLVQVIVAWVVVLILAAVATGRIGRLTAALSQNIDAHAAALGEVEELQMRTAVLQVLSRSVDVPLAFQELASRLVHLVPCDRVGLALLSENGEEFQTYTARVDVEERRTRPRPDIVFKAERTALGAVVRSREPLLLNELRQGAADFLDVNVLHTAGFGSAVLVPLVAKGRAVGTLNAVSRRVGVFQPHHIEVLKPVAEMFAVAYVAQQLQIAVGKHRSMEAMSDLTLSIAADINSALQTIIGHCDLLERGYPDPSLQRDLAMVVLQAQRVSTLLEKMRTAANERLKAVAETVNQGGIPSSPEAYKGKGDIF